MSSARAAAGTAALAALLATGCSGTRGGTSLDAFRADVNTCAAVLPLARDSVADRGTLVAVRAVGRTQVDRILRAAGRVPPAARPASPTPVPTATSTPVGAGNARLCVIAYRGPYAAGQVASEPLAHGKFAVLILRVRRPALRYTLLVDRLPPGV